MSYARHMPEHIHGFVMRKNRDTEGAIYNAETMAAMLREGEALPVGAPREEPFMEHIWGYTHMGRGTRFYPIGAGPLASVTSGDVYALARSAQMFTNVIQLSAQQILLEKLSHQLPGIVNYPASICSASKGLSLSALKTRIFGDIGNIEKFLISAWWTGLSNGMGSSYAQAAEQYYNPGQLRFAYNTLQYHTSIIPRMRRYWLSQYTPSVPDESLAWTLLRRGVIKQKQFETYCSWQGWDKTGAGLLQAAWHQIPTEREAFRMHKRGLLTRKEFQKYIYMNGWPEEWWYKLYGMFASLPSIGQAARMHLRGSLTAEQYMGYAEYNGYNPYEAERMMVNYLAYPTPREANYMWRRNFIDKPTRNKFYKAQGYLESMHELISKNYTQIFNPLNAFKLRMRGALSFTEYAQAVYENRWEREQVFKFDALYQNIPTSQEAFFMWSKGLLTVGQRDFAYKAYGWMEKWHSKLTENYYYVPSIYDLFRIADAVELDEIWAADVMTRRGVQVSDQAKLWPMLKIRPLRDEIVRQVYIWIRRYELGWASDVQLEAALDKMIGDGYIQTTEKTLITEEAHLKYENELMAEQIVIYMWYFRMAVITETQYLDALMALGIRREKANLMVAEQTAMGYYGYY